MHVGELLHLESSLQTSGEVESSAHDEKRPLLIELFGDLLDLVIQGQHLLYFLREVPQSVYDLFSSRLNLEC